MTASQWAGKTIDGRYVVDRVLGEGGMGVVLGAHHQFTGANVAVKLIRPELQLSAELQQRFLAEARAANAIGHPGIAQVMDAGKAADGSLYLVMELLEGRSLRAAMLAEPLAPEQIRRILRELLDVLAVAHSKGFVHRDLKPDNVFLAGPAGGVKLLDFGIAKVLGAGTGHALTMTGTMMGTPAYMAPEQLRDASSVDPRADLWAVGVMAYELVAGRLPFLGTIDQMLVAIASRAPDPIRAYVGDASPTLDVFVTRALARDPRGRFQTAAEMAAAIASVELPARGSARTAQPAVMTPPASWANAATPPPASIATPPPVVTSPAPQGGPRVLKWIALVLALVMVAGGVAFLVRRSGEGPATTAPSKDVWDDPNARPAVAAAPDATPAPTDAGIDTAAAARQQSCEEGCRAASACDLAPAQCVSRCVFHDTLYACVSLARSCDATARCFLAERCGRTMIPRGTKSCLATLVCTKSCADRGLGDDCACACIVDAKARHVLSLTKIAVCGNNCGSDQACAKKACKRLVEHCARN